MNKEVIGAIALFVLCYGLISRKLEKSVVTPPMAYVSFGLLISSSGLGLLENVEITNKTVKVLAEITLAVLLFTDASRIKLELLREEYRLPLRLLGIGLPITIVLGAIAALWLFPELDLWSAFALATILSPTDAALGQAVVNSSRVPGCIRQAINIESGLNDGICLPILLLFISLAANKAGENSATYWLIFTFEQIFLGTIIGMAIGYGGNKLVAKSLQYQWMTRSFEDLSILGLSILAYTSAEVIGGNGFIAAFCAGLTLGLVGKKSFVQSLQEFGEAEGQLLTLMSFLLYGAIMVIPSLIRSTWQIWVYGIISLTIARMLGVAIATAKLDLQLDSTLFIGWFGPRGIASLVYGLLIMEKDSFQNSQLMFDAMAIVVLISIFAHGLTAFPGVNWYAKRLDNKKNAPHPIKEMLPVNEIPVRLPWKD